MSDEEFLHVIAEHSVITKICLLVTFWISREIILWQNYFSNIFVNDSLIIIFIAEFFLEFENLHACKIVAVFKIQT